MYLELTHLVGVLIHATHEAAFKMGGIGAVLLGLVGSPYYQKAIKRTLLVGPLDTYDNVNKQRLEKEVKFLYYKKCNVNELSSSIAEALSEIEGKYGVEIIYGKRKLSDIEVEVILVDPKEINKRRENLFKGDLYRHLGLASIKYEQNKEYEFFISAAPPLWESVELLCVEEKLPKVILAHEFMGMPLIFCSKMYSDNNYTTIFYAHEVATVRPLIEQNPGHDTMFYNTLEKAMAEGKYLEEVFGSQEEFFKHPLIKRSILCDGIFAVGDSVVKEFRFLGPEFRNFDIDLVYNGIPAQKISASEKIASRNKLKAYANNLFGIEPDYIFTHVTRLVPSKGLWRDIRVLEHLDKMLAKEGKEGIMFFLSSGVPQGRSKEDILKMERYGWPVVHREGKPDLISYEIPFYGAIKNFNEEALAIKCVLVNQFGWSRELCGLRMPEDMNFMDIRKGTDVEFGQSIYEPFGIAQLEPLSFGAICVYTNICGCAGAVRKALGGKTSPLLIEANYTQLPENEYDLEALLKIGQVERNNIEILNSNYVAKNIFSALPVDDAQREKYLEMGYKLSLKMSWDNVVKDQFIPGIKRAIKKAGESR